MSVTEKARRCLLALKQQGKKIAFAESCTGGLLAKLLTDLGGASEVFECGIVSYSNKIKHSLLGVSKETLDTYTAVSEPTAKEMAAGVRRISGADVGVSVTGYAGPDGENVGLIYVGISHNKTTSVYRLELYEDMTRTERREFAAGVAFDKVTELFK